MSNFTLASVTTDACHQLSNVNGKTEMAFIGETPWHHLGQELPHGATVDQMIAAANMQWKLMKSRVRFAASRGAADSELHTIDDQIVLFRSDTHQPLGLVSAAYKVVQPSQMLEFFRNLVAKYGYELCTAGVLFGGKKFWALAKVADGAVTGSDKIGAYVLITSSCDGSSATEVRFTAIRVVCNNTFTLATQSSKAGARVSHRSHFSIAAVQERMGLVHDSFADYLTEARELAAKRITDRDAATFVRKLLRPEEAQAQATAQAQAAAAIAQTQGSSDFDRLIGKAPAQELQAGDDAKVRAPKGEAEILALFRGHGHGAQLASAMGTAWGLVNAVTEYVDHKAQAKSIDHRVDRAFFGSGDELKTRAFEMARAL